MSKVTIEVEQEQIDALVTADLKCLLEYLKNDLAVVQDTQRGRVFDTDWQEDEKELKKHIKAFKRVLKYYGESV